VKNIRLLWIVTISVTMASADITIMDYLNTKAIGSGGERVILGDGKMHHDSIDRVSPTTPPPPTIVSPSPSTKLQECYKSAEKLVAKIIKANQNNDPSQSISIVTIDASKECSETNKQCSEKAWQVGKKCFTSRHEGMTPAQVAKKCNTISHQGTIKCILMENRCSHKYLIEKCKTDYSDVKNSINISHPIDSTPNQTDNIEEIDDINNDDTTTSDEEYEKQEYIKQYQQDIETQKNNLDRVEARLRAELEKGVQDSYHKRRIEIYQDSIRTIRIGLENNKDQLRKLGGREKRHIQRDQSDVYRDIEHNRAIYDAQQELKSKQKETRNTRMLIDKFGDDPEARRLTIKKVKELSKNASLDRLRDIKSAVKKQYYDAWVADQESETVKQQEIEKELGISESRTILIRDTAVTINSTLGMVYGGGAIATLHGVTNNAVKAVYKDKETGLVVSIVKDMVDNYTFKLGGELIDIPYRLYKYHHDGVDVPSDMKVYDKDGNLLTKVKSGEKLYDVKGNNINYSFVRRLERYKLWTTTARDDILNKDINKKVNGFLDIINNGKSLGELLWKLH